MTILDLPIHVDHSAERISTHNGGATIDFNGNEEQRREAMRFYEQAPAMARALIGEMDPDGHVIACGNGGSSPDDCSPRCRRVVAVLRDAGILP